MTVHPGGDVEAWRTFLLLLGRSPESVRTDGGIARVWTTMAGRHVELREIDYAEVLRERAGGEPAVWNSVIANCLQGSSFDLDEEGIRELLGIAGDSDTAGRDLMATLESSAAAAAASALKTAALMRMLRGIVDAVSKKDPEQLEPVLQNMATAVGQLLARDAARPARPAAGDDDGAAADAGGRQPDDRRDDRALRLAARDRRGDTPTDRLAQAFQTLVPRRRASSSGCWRWRKTTSRRRRSAAPKGSRSVWNNVAEKLLTSYSDEPFVSDAYGTRAVRRAHPGDRGRAASATIRPSASSAWLGTIATTALRALDLTLLIDLLRIEQDEERWRELMKPVVGLIEDLLLVGDFDAAAELVGVLVGEAGGDAADGAPAARDDRDRRAGRRADDAPHRRPTWPRSTKRSSSGSRRCACRSAKCWCGRSPKRSSVEERPRTARAADGDPARVRRRRPADRRAAEELAECRRCAGRRSTCCGEFGGSDALPDLTELLDDNEPQVQREAVRAILNIGTDAAYQDARAGARERHDAVARRDHAVDRPGARRARDAAVRLHPRATSITAARSAPVYLRAIESLGALRDPDGIAPLREALYQGEWWAPRRTGALRAAAAAALARIGTPDALAVLDEAVVARARAACDRRRARSSHRPRAASGARHGEGDA